MKHENEEVLIEDIIHPKRESLLRTMLKHLNRESRVIFRGLRNGLSDTLVITSRILLPNRVDKTVKPQSAWYEQSSDTPNGKAIMLCHGFGLTPAIFNKLTNDLVTAGYYIRSIRLAGHGTSPEHLAQTTSVNWFSSVVWHFQELRKTYKDEDIVFIGHSVGGALGMLLATIYPIRSVIALAAPIYLDIPPAKFVREASIFVPFWPRSKEKLAILEKEGISTYRVKPLFAVGGIFEATSVLRSRHEFLNCPILYIRAMHDTKNMKDQPNEFRKYFPSADVTFKDAKNSPHAMLQGPEYQEIHQWVLEWCNKQFKL